MGVRLRCACGEITGEISDPGHSNRVVCYCDDCQAFARWLGRDDLVNARGGTDIAQVAPTQIRIDGGREHLRAVRLSDRGLMRWFCGKCRLPVGNLLALRRSPFVGIPVVALDLPDDRARDAALGPAEGIYGKFAIGGCPPDVPANARLGLMARSVRFMLGNVLRGRAVPSPYVDEASPMALQVLTPDERAALNPG